MKFLLDANMPYSAKKILRQFGHPIHVRDVGLADASDDTILKYAQREDAIVVSRDLDFANIILHPINAHAGAIVLRVPSSFTAEQIKKVLAQFLAVVDVTILSRVLTIVEPGQFRMRRGEVS
jgi:predicted nuclease of predicted toxin-antitoxin system